MVKLSFIAGLALFGCASLLPGNARTVNGLVAVEGRFELGPKEDPDGSVSHFRLFVH